MHTHSHTQKRSNEFVKSSESNGFRQWKQKRHSRYRHAMFRQNKVYKLRTLLKVLIDDENFSLITNSDESESTKELENYSKCAWETMRSVCVSVWPGRIITDFSKFSLSSIDFQNPNKKNKKNKKRGTKNETTTKNVEFKQNNLFYRFVLNKVSCKHRFRALIDCNANLENDEVTHLNIPNYDSCF